MYGLIVVAALLGPIGMLIAAQSTPDGYREMTYVALVLSYTLGYLSAMAALYLDGRILPHWKRSGKPT